MRQGLGKSGKTRSYWAKSVCIKVKYHDFKSASKSNSFPHPIENLTDFIRTGTRLLSEFQIKNRSLHLIGIGMSLLTGRNEKTRQLNLNLE